MAAPTVTTNDTAHVAVAPPALPTDTFLTEPQWRVWYALMDAVTPSIIPGDSSSHDNGAHHALPASDLDAIYARLQTTMLNPPSRPVFDALLAEQPSSTTSIRASHTRTLSYLPPKAHAALGGILGVLGTTVGSLLLTGHAAPFYDLPVHVREGVLRAWFVSWVPTLRGLARTVTRLGLKAYVQGSPGWLGSSGWRDLPGGYVAGKAAECSFKTFSDDGDEAGVVLETDVVVVGSGCGGGVVAKRLAEAGHRVVVVDKGYYFPPAQLPMTTEAAEKYLFEREVVTSDDGGVTTVSGAAWGGGGTVNWGVSLKTPRNVREDWAANRGLGFFVGAEYEATMEGVCEFMGVSGGETVRQTHRGQVLLDGARKLGWRAGVTPHNSGGQAEEHHDGHCHFGCGSGRKQGPAVSWLPAAYKAGAEFIEGFKVDKITFEESASGKRASGVVGTWTSRDKEGSVSGPLEERTTREITIKAKRVVVACGSLRSPAILKYSGLSNPQIGQHLYLHPSHTVHAFWKHETNPWEGCAITSVCTEFDDLDGKGHGAKLETVSMVPYGCVTFLPWTSGLDAKLAALHYRHMGTFLSMARDRDAGHVYLDPAASGGRPKIAYTPSRLDMASVFEGVVALARICYVQGAEDIRPGVPNVRPFVRAEFAGQKSEDVDQRFEEWVKHLRGVGTSATSWWQTAHQMGSCRMSVREEDGVVDPRGRVWGVRDLYVADASVLPSATGVNPMVSAMSVADWIAKGIDRDLRGEV